MRLARPIGPPRKLRRRPRKNPAWLMSNPFGEASQLNRAKIPYGDLRRVLYGQANEPFRAPVGYMQPLEISARQNRMQAPPQDAVSLLAYWMNNTHLVLPVGDPDMRQMVEDHGNYEDAQAFFELDAWVEGFQSWGTPGGVFTPWDMSCSFITTRTGVVAGIYFVCLSRMNIDDHPHIQMGLYTLLLALRQEGCIVPETILATGSYVGQTLDMRWEALLEQSYERAAEDEPELANDPSRQAEFDEYREQVFDAMWSEEVREIGLSADARLVKHFSQLSTEDYWNAVEAYGYDADWMDMGMPPAGEMLEILASGPYSCPTDYSPVPGVPGYMPQALPGAPDPRTLPPPPEAYAQYGGPALPAPAQHPAAQHAPEQYGALPAPPEALGEVIGRKRRKA